MTPKQNVECSLVDAESSLETIVSLVHTLSDYVSDDEETAADVDRILEKLTAAMSTLKNELDDAQSHLYDVDDEQVWENEGNDNYWLASSLQRMYEMYCQRHGYAPGIDEDPWVQNFREALEAASATAQGVGAESKLQSHTSLALRWP